MLKTTISSREFNQNRSRATKAMVLGPVVVTDRGKPSFVLMSYEEFQRITSKPRSLVDALAMPGLDEIDLDALIARPRDAPKPFEFD